MRPDVGWDYCVWFRDTDLPVDDEDYEWPAVFFIQAESSEQAKRWGDRLAARHCETRSERQFLWSSVSEESEARGTSLPVVQAGTWATDSEIGW